ncbi:fructose-1,6-bisphosphatase [Brotonthovivens ammoniilytica]|uniref:Fructose-1,6-bisphosphatase class 3 n=1 Tax=Brotonthovivens ammoniilytica TaxID=2981725 RepID=A0ABT2TJX6_9FIRM|nr:fructose-1,6-bisphosphatase [Brotonthovivens ammoniilytica]MCU6762505.1 fructose-1,6-bisphosphatase [Brotonthovivens ammoniilytica]
MKDADMKYLKVLAKQYPNIASAATEIVNLKAILSLPKGTEHFITDIHGEYEQFRHILSNGSGAIQRKIEEEFGSSLAIPDKRTLAMLIYYPECKLEQIQEQLLDGEALEDWYRVIIFRLIRVCKTASSKYTRSKVRKSLPKDFAYIIEELMTGRPDVADQEAYYNEIINSVIRTGRASDLIVDFCYLIRRFTVDHLHVLGDIFDRGPYPHLIMDTLMQHHSIDIQWGNHDVLWMGAAAGQTACMCNMLRISAKYGNLSILEDAYGINMLPLARLALNQYADDSCSCFHVDTSDENYDNSYAELDEKMHKAISIIQFKLEGQLILKYPEWDMQERLLLDKMDLEKGTIIVEGKEYKLKETCFPTVDPKNPYQLTAEEKDVVDRLRASFLNSERLQKHTRFLFTKGSFYKVYNGNLLYHGCVPLNEDGSFKEVEIYGKKYSGKALYDILEHYARKGYYSLNPVEKEKGRDIMWFIWKNKNSPVFGKAKMTTFERYFILDKKTHEEPKNPYYKLIEKEEVVNRILTEFGLPSAGAHIINGHVPVAVKKGESPVKCNGKLLIIDGGFSKAYQSKTGIAGYTLIYNSYGLVLAAHEPFESMEKTVLNETCIHSHIVMEQNVVKRKTVGDTDTGKVLRENIAELEELLEAYRSGCLIENV